MLEGEFQDSCEVGSQRPSRPCLFLAPGWSDLSRVLEAQEARHESGHRRHQTVWCPVLDAVTRDQQSPVAFEQDRRFGRDCFAKQEDSPSGIGNRVESDKTTSDEASGDPSAPETVHRFASQRMSSHAGSLDGEFATLESVDWFNNRRLLEPIGDIPPAEFEKMYYERLKSPAM